jgi:hypothetical protein
MDPEHFGVLVPYSHGELPASYRTILERRAPGVSAEEIIPIGHDGLRTQLEKFIEVGASKFVPILVGEPDDWFAELEGVANVVLPLQN